MKTHLSISAIKFVCVIATLLLILPIGPVDASQLGNGVVSMRSSFDRCYYIAWGFIAESEEKTANDITEHAHNDYTVVYTGVESDCFGGRWNTSKLKAEFKEALARRFPQAHTIQVLGATDYTSSQSAREERKRQLDILKRQYGNKSQFVSVL